MNNTAIFDTGRLEVLFCSGFESAGSRRTHHEDTSLSCQTHVLLDPFVLHDPFLLEVGRGSEASTALLRIPWTQKHAFHGSETM